MSKVLLSRMNTFAPTRAFSFVTSLAKAVVILKKIEQNKTSLIHTYRKYFLNQVKTEDKRLF